MGPSKGMLKNVLADITVSPDGTCSGLAGGLTGSAGACGLAVSGCGSLFEMSMPAKDDKSVVGLGRFASLVCCLAKPILRRVALWIIDSRFVRVAVTARN